MTQRTHSGDDTFKRASSAEQLAEALRTALYSGELPPGSGLRDSQLAERFSVSRGTVREAIQILAAEGLVDRPLHRTPQVRRLTGDDVDDIYHARQILELDAVRVVAERDSEVEFGILTAAATRFQRAVGDQSGIQVVEADADFHAGLVSFLGTPRLLSCFEACFGELRLALSAVDRIYSDLDEQREWHIRFVGLLEALHHNPTPAHLELVTDTLTEHLESARKMVGQILAEAEPG
ncbi:MAG: GntR family transcriptional regulator [Actinobacteria bacterium]|nr:GntR family transcriptional regulator [Actinomycetota bacterium]